ncbi:Fe/S biogenesis protein NfuA [Serratia symbiotica]|nr:Fe/S biogenesis protein NfuA [Serratia symbiotica]
MIHITHIAQKHFLKLLMNQKKGTQIRVFVINHNTIEATCKVSYCPKNTINKTDIKIKFKNFSVFIDKKSAPYLKNAEIDFITNQLNSQLTLKAPNVKTKQNNNISLLKRIKYFIKSKINPQLALHGGYIDLIKITEKKIAILKFYGNCNGCSMINITFKEVIEKKILMNFPEISSVKNITNHQ